MAKTQMEDLRAKTVDELSAAVLELKKKQMAMRFEQASGQLKDTDGKRRVRRDIARAKTALTAKVKQQKGEK
ncbi:50S ribosomal protein L29 [Alphaproteobacteria bacterium]|nr:50S ribosomal protein L29 [Alphaproteobacteria bacterium]